MKPLLVGLLLISPAFADSPNRFEVSDGQMTVSTDHHLMVSSKEFRATLRDPTKQHVIIRFKYLGPTQEISHLQNGEIRHQLGIKLKAKDICNLVYVMWNFDTSKIDIGVKRNQGKRTSQECRDNGYHYGFGRPMVSEDPESIIIDRWYSLEAELGDKHLIVKLNGKTMWEGDLTDDQREFVGPVGIRTDNVHVLFDYTAE